MARFDTDPINKATRQKIEKRIHALVIVGENFSAVGRTREGRVAVSPGIGFGPGGEGFVRFALVENEQRIRQAVRGIGGVLAGERSR